MLNSEIQMFLAREMTDASTNGGVMSVNQVISGVVQNVWAHVPKVDRDTGKTQDRKIFLANRNVDNEALLNAGYYYDGDTLGADHAYFFPVDQRDTQVDWQGTPPSRMFVSGVLLNDVNSSDSSFTVIFDDTSQASHILETDTIIVSDKADPDSGAGNTEQKIITGTPSLSGAQATCNITTQFANSYLAGSKVCVVYIPGVDVAPSLGTVVVTSALGTLDHTKIILDNLGTIEHEILLSFSAANLFSASSDDPRFPSMPGGDINSIYAPDNSDVSRPFLNIPIDAWGGTFDDGDTVLIPCHPAAVPLVQRRKVPPLCPSLANNRIRQVIIGESQT